MRRRQAAQSRQEIRLRRHDPHVARHRLDDNRRDLFRKAFEQAFHGVQVVKGRGQRVLGRAGRHARAVRQAQRSYSTPGLHQQHIGVSVIASLKLDDLVPARKGAR